MSRSLKGKGKKVSAAEVGTSANAVLERQQSQAGQNL